MTDTGTEFGPARPLDTERDLCSAVAILEARLHTVKTAVDRRRCEQELSSARAALEELRSRGDRDGSGNRINPADRNHLALRQIRTARDEIIRLAAWWQAAGTDTSRLSQPLVDIQEALAVLEASLPPERAAPEPPPPQSDRIT